MIEVECEMNYKLRCCVQEIQVGVLVRLPSENVQCILEKMFLMYRRKVKFEAKY